MARVFVVFAFLILASLYDDSICAYSVCEDWLPYNELCYKIVDNTTRTYDDSVTSCHQLDVDSTLAIIHNKEEQDFLTTYLFKKMKKVDNFWLGAKFSSDTNKFKWTDNTDFSYTNWDTTGARNKANYCIQMQADEAVVGKWLDQPCEKKNLVLCQKAQTWSFGRLQKEFLRDRFRLIELKNNPVPIGFLYVQLPNQAEPTTLWPNVQWSDVTAEYAGLFFRAEGGGSEQFGSVQSENAPRVTEVKHVGPYLSTDGKNWQNTTLNVGGWSSGIGVFTGSCPQSRACYGHILFQSGGEIRPRNMAMRFWKRVG